MKPEMKTATQINSSLKSWMKTWTLSLLIVLIFLILYESFLNSKKHQKSIASNKDLWSFYRAQIRDAPDSLLILGGSRAQLGLNMAVLEEKLPEKNIVGLTINGQYPLATFAEVVNDPSFVGEIWLSLVAQALEPRYWDMQKPHNQHFKNKSSFYKRWESFVSAWVQYQFLFTNPELSLPKIIKSLDKNKTFPQPFYVQEHLDLSKTGDYSKQNQEALVNHFVSQKEKNYEEQPPMDKEVFTQQLSKLKSLIKKFEKRGGKVVIIRMPTDKGHWELDNTFYPKKTFWNQLVEFVEVPTVHFKDYETLSTFELPDSSHLDQKDTAEFTRALYEIITNEIQR